jgi:hypothetical protein
MIHFFISFFFISSEVINSQTDENYCMTTLTVNLPAKVTFYTRVSMGSKAAACKYRMLPDVVCRILDPDVGYTHVFRTINLKTSQCKNSNRK